MTIILIIIIGVLLFVLKDKIFGDGKSSAGNKTTYFPPSNSYSVPSKTIAPKLSVWQKFRKNSVLNNDFYGKRIDFYQEEIAKLSNDPYYSPMFIYNAFYLNPLCF